MGLTQHPLPVSRMGRGTAGVAVGDGCGLKGDELSVDATVAATGGFPVGCVVATSAAGPRLRDAHEVHASINNGAMMSPNRVRLRLANRGPGRRVVIDQWAAKVSRGLVEQCLPTLRIGKVLLEHNGGAACERDSFPVSVDKRHRIEGETVGSGVTNLQVQMWPRGACSIGVAAQGYDLPGQDLLSHPELRPLQQVAIEGRVAIGMHNHQVVRPGPVAHVVDLGHHAVPDGYHLGSTARSQVDPKVQPLTGRVHRAPEPIGEYCVSVGLDQQPGRRAGGSKKRQPKRCRMWLMRLIPCGSGL